MPETKWTPGPWLAEPADMFGDHNIVLSDGEDRRAVAAVVSNMRDPSEVAANARLIAAAPDMLEALVFITDENAPYSATQAWRDRIVEARTKVCAAIAKARGETP